MPGGASGNWKEDSSLMSMQRAFTSYYLQITTILSTFPLHNFGELSLHTLKGSLSVWSSYQHDSAFNSAHFFPNFFSSSLNHIAFPCGAVKIEKWEKFLKYLL